MILNPPTKKKKPHKYGAKKCTINGHKFDSLAEGRRYVVLKALEKAGKIYGLTLQPRFELMPGFRFNGQAVRKIEYVADFRYLEAGKVIIEDVKGQPTPVYLVKKKLFLHQYCLPNAWEFRET